MSQWMFYFNQDRCLGCKACTLACKNWNEKNRGDVRFTPREEAVVLASSAYTAAEGQNQPTNAYIDSKGALATAELGKYYMKETWRRVTEYNYGAIILDNETNTFKTNYERTYLSVGCNHCDEPACKEACPMGLFYKEEKYGLVLYDNGGCISCGRCQDACPWDAPQFYDTFSRYSNDDPNRPRMNKCTGCYDRIEEGLKPACVAACRARALDFGPADEIASKYNYNYVDELPEFNRDTTQPNIIFRKKTNNMKQS